ncbi:protein Hook homolog 2 isoform X2 [Nannospalax galili]|uniref:protein Hook homolog 2 isoform X2 n=1 Tax=Nannospalax galili TaxID=1026970 RepID=UPI00111BDCD6|nr:protein Hook homolog 2 isoform X2 [Nannospalax galili]
MVQPTALSCNYEFWRLRTVPLTRWRGAQPGSGARSPWQQLQTFQVPYPCASPQDLNSGLAIARVLNQIDSSWFNEAWLKGISEDPGPNWRLKISKLEKILQSLVEYWQDVLGHPVLEQHLPDVSLIGEFSDPSELGKLLQLVLGCAISCEKKQEHIQRIMTLEESVQHVVMEAIQELMTKDIPDTPSPETYGNFDTQSRRYYFLSEEAEEGDELQQHCLDLERQLMLLSEEKQSLVQENAALREQMGRPEVEGAPGLTTKKLLLLQSQLEQLQEENFRLESSREDERLHCMELEREVTELQQRNQALTSLAQEAQALKDEMDELRQSSERAGQLEATLNSCRQRLGELRELRRQVRQLEERNAGHAERTRQLEDELRRAGSLRAQLETQRRQVQELQGQWQEEAMKAEKWLFECQNLEEKYESVTKEKERLLTERDSLREANEELRCAQLQPRGLTQTDPLPDPTPSGLENLAAEILPAELRETLLRLQLENKRLCQQEAADRERQEELQRHLEEANRARHGLETQHRLNQQQLLELRAQVEDLQKALQEQGGKTEDVSAHLLPAWPSPVPPSNPSFSPCCCLMPDAGYCEYHGPRETPHPYLAQAFRPPCPLSSAVSFPQPILLKRKLEEHLQKLHEADLELQRKREYIEELEPPTDSNTRRIEELQDNLQKKDADLRAMEERYRRYVDKARKVIQTLEPKQQLPVRAPLELQALKTQLRERDVRIRHLEMDFEKSRSQREQEEKLLISAWYSMGMALDHWSGEERAPAHAQSFLAQQRLATNARRGPPGRLTSLSLRPADKH